MLQLSLDGKRLYVTDSLYSSWDNQFYTEIAKAVAYLLQIDCDRQNCDMKTNEHFYIGFGKELADPARAKELADPAQADEMRYPGGHCTSDICV